MWSGTSSVWGEANLVCLTFKIPHPNIYIIQLTLNMHIINAILIFRETGQGTATYTVYTWGSAEHHCSTGYGSVLSISFVDLEKHPENRARLKEFFGLLGGYIIAVTGHRKGVVINMTTKEVKEAEKTKQGARIIRVSANITTKAERTRDLHIVISVGQTQPLSWIIRLDSTRLKGTLVKQLYPSSHTSIPGAALQPASTQNRRRQRSFYLLSHDQWKRPAEAAWIFQGGLGGNGLGNSPNFQHAALLCCHLCEKSFQVFVSLKQLSVVKS